MGGARAVARQPYHSPPQSPPSESPGPEIIDVRIRILFIFRECAANSYTRLRRSLLFYRSATDRSIGKLIALFQFMPESVFVFYPKWLAQCTKFEFAWVILLFIFYLEVIEESLWTVQRWNYTLTENTYIARNKELRELYRKPKRSRRKKGSLLSTVPENAPQEKRPALGRPD